MKKLFLLTLSLFLFSNIIAQNKLSLELKDGTAMDGFGRIKNNETILFKKTEDAEKEFYNYTTVKKIILYADDSEQNYEYKIIEDFNGIRNIILLEILKIGKVNLYQNYGDGIVYHGPITPSGFGGSSYSKTKYYLSKSEDDIVTNLKNGNTYSKRFKKIAKTYFTSCPDLLEKINNKFFKRYEIHSVVEYFNEKCN